MVKIRFVYFTIVLIFTSAFSQIDTTDIGFYPLHTGNYWEYQNIGAIWGAEVDTTYFSLKVLGDTVLSDNLKYKIIEKRSIPDTLPVEYRYERIDTLTLNTYREGDLLDSLKSHPGDIILNSIRSGYGYLIPSAIICDDEFPDTVLNTPTVIKHFYDDDFTVDYSFELAHQLGFIGEQFYEDFGGFHIQTLVYARIKGNVYGNPLSIHSDDYPIEKFELYQNYPNPFNPVTTISFNLPQSDHVKLTIYDVTGRKNTDIVEGKMEAGEHSIQFDAHHLSSGVYFYRLQVGHKFVRTRKMILMR